MISWYAQEDVIIIVAKLSTCGIWLFSLFDIPFVIGKFKGCMGDYFMLFFTFTSILVYSFVWNQDVR